MWHEWLGKLFSQIGAQLAAIGAAIAAVVSAVIYHRHKVSSAERAGRDDGVSIERNRIRRDAEKATEYLEQRANEIENQVRRDTADPDDLRQRMRDAAASDHRAK